MKKLLLLVGVFALGYSSISARSVPVSSECNIKYRYIERFLCGDVLQGEYIVPPPGGGTATCTEIVDFITNHNDPIPVCWHMHPPGGRY